MHLAQDDDPGDDHRGAARLDAVSRYALVRRHRGEPLELRLDRGERQSVAVRSRGVVLCVAEVERRERRDRAGDANRAPCLERREERAHVRARGGKLWSRRRIRAQEALGDPHAADVEARRERDLAVSREHELRGAAADVHDEHVVEGGRPAVTPRIIIAASSVPASRRVVNP